MDNKDLYICAVSGLKYSFQKYNDILFCFVSVRLR